MCKHHRGFLVALALTALAAISGPGATKEPTRQDLIAIDLSLGTAGDLVGLSDESWLFGGGDALMLIVDGESKHLYDGRYESLDVREDLSYQGGTYDLIAAIDADTGNVALFLSDFDRRSFHVLREIEYKLALPEAICLHRDPTTSNVSLFSLDARGMLEQRYVYDGSREVFTDVVARVDVGVPDAEACAVDDESRSLYVADEQFGIRRLDAHEETDTISEPWKLVAPFGDLDGEIEDIAVEPDGAVWALVPDAERLYRFAADGSASHLPIAELTAPASLAVGSSGLQESVALFDEDSGDLWLWEGTLRSGDEVSDTQRTDQQPPAVILASDETEPVRRFADAADDPAVLMSSDAAPRPLILGTDKREGLAVYELDGSQRQFLPVGRLNNVDAASAVVLGGSAKTIAAASNRSNGGISLFQEKAGVLEHLGDFDTTLDDVYGLCMYHSQTGLYVFINDTSGAYEQYIVNVSADGASLTLVRQFALPSQPEGCAADSETQRIYMGEEEAGVWMAGAEPDGAAPEFIIPVGNELVADVEGMDVYRKNDEALLVISSQGNDSFAIFDLNAGYELVAHFRIGADLDEELDGVSETDGLAVSALKLPGYPQGILVVQDGRNRMPSEPQNFKIVDWRSVQQVIRR